MISFGPGNGVELTATELVPVGQKTIQGPVALVSVLERGGVVAARGDHVQRIVGLVLGIEYRRWDRNHRWGPDRCRDRRRRRHRLCVLGDQQAQRHEQQGDQPDADVVAARCWPQGHRNCPHQRRLPLAAVPQPCHVCLSSAGTRTPPSHRPYASGNYVNGSLFVLELAKDKERSSPPSHGFFAGPLKRNVSCRAVETARSECFPPEESREILRPPSQDVVTVGEAASALGVPGVETSKAGKVQVVIAEGATAPGPPPAVDP